MSEPEVYECNEPDVIFEDFGDETVLIHLGSGHYYSLDPIGMALWDVLSARVPVADVVRHALARHDGDADEVRAAVVAFVARLRDEELIRSASAPAPAPAVDAGARAAFAPPTLRKFEDMQEMLLLDPVHDVGMEGWPTVDRAPPPDAPNDAP